MREKTRKRAFQSVFSLPIILSSYLGPADIPTSFPNVSAFQNAVRINLTRNVSLIGSSIFKPRVPQAHILWQTTFFPLLSRIWRTNPSLFHLRLTTCQKFGIISAKNGRTAPFSTGKKSSGAGCSMPSSSQTFEAGLRGGPRALTSHNPRCFSIFSMTACPSINPMTRMASYIFVAKPTDHTSLEDNLRGLRLCNGVNRMEVKLEKTERESTNGSVMWN